MILLADVSQSLSFRRVLSEEIIHEEKDISIYIYIYIYTYIRMINVSYYQSI